MRTTRRRRNDNNNLAFKDTPTKITIMIITIITIYNRPYNNIQNNAFEHI